LLSNWHETGFDDPVHCPIEQTQAYSSRFTQNECDKHAFPHTIAEWHEQSFGSYAPDELQPFLISIFALAII
jgi:hypothetical protein